MITEDKMPTKYGQLEWRDAGFHSTQGTRFEIIAPSNVPGHPAVIAKLPYKPHAQLFVQAGNLFPDLVKAARKVVDCWESGDLAGAVNELESIVCEAENNDC